MNVKKYRQIYQKACPNPPYWIKFLILYTLYFFTARLGLQIEAVSNFATLVWAPTGISLAALFLYGYKLWPAVFLAAASVNMTLGAPWYVSSGIGIGNSLEALLGAYFLKQFNFNPTFNHLRDVVYLVIFAAVISTLISATVGVTSLYLGGILAFSSIGYTWFAWWIGDATSNLLIAPFLMVCCAEKWSLYKRNQIFELVLLFIVIIIVSILIFGFYLSFIFGVNRIPFFLIYPFFIWASLRFSRRVAFTATLLVAVIAIWNSINDQSSFIGSSTLESIFNMQIFIIVACITNMIISTIISDWQKTKRSLSDQAEKLTSIVDNVVDGIITIDTKNQIASWNSAAKSIFGYEENEVIGQNIEMLIDKSRTPTLNLYVSDYVRSEKTKMKQGGRKVSGKRKDGSIFPMDIAVSEFTFAKQKLFTAIIRDITERQKSESELHKAKDAAESANRAKSSFLANMSHEIRTPLGAILGFSELLASSTLTASERCEFDSAVKRNGELLTNLINDILDLSKVEAEKLEVERTYVSLKQILMDVSATINLKAKEKDLNLSVKTEGNIPKYIQTDALRLQQIIINIIGNAIKFTQQGTIKIIMRYLIEKNKSTFEIDVHDSGIGIAKENIEILFEPFNQADASTKRRFGGTGLGLVLSRKLARLLGGDVVLLKSELGKGSSFKISIDAGKPQIDLATDFFKEDELPSFSKFPAHNYELKNLKILLVEDNPDNQYIISNFLNKTGAIVEVADNGKLGYEKAIKNSYDLILMDLQMPEMDGHEAVAALRKNGYNKPIIALTAHVLKEVRLRCLASGFDDHISKPIDLAILQKTISKHIQFYNKTHK